MNNDEMLQKLREILNSHSMKEKLNTLSAFDVCIKMLQKEVNDDIKNNYVYCNNCHNYILKETLKEDSEEKTIHECVHADCGYGDDDIYADVTYLFTYYICPKCGQKILNDKYYLYQNNRGRK